MKGTDKRMKLVKLTGRGSDFLQALEVYGAALQGNFALIKALVERQSKINKET